MIGYLKGYVADIEKDACIIEVGGVGYRVYCPAATLQYLQARVSDKGDPVKLITRVLHREDVLDLYGFLHRDEYTLFNMLLRVSGIGPRQALKILGMGKTAQIVRAIVSGDDSFLMQLPGIGKKRAQQIIFDLRERLKNTFEVAATEDLSAYSTAVAALEALGFSGMEAHEAVDVVVSSTGDELDVSQVIERALKVLSSGM